MLLGLFKLSLPVIALALINEFVLPEGRQVPLLVAVGLSYAFFSSKFIYRASKRQKQFAQDLAVNGFVEPAVDSQADLALQSFSPIQHGNSVKVKDHFVRNSGELGVFKLNQRVGMGKYSRKSFSVAYVRLEQSAPHIVFDSKYQSDGDILFKNVSNFGGLDNLQEYNLGLHPKAAKRIKVLFDPAAGSSAARVIEAVLSSQSDIWYGIEYEIRGNYLFAVTPGFSSTEVLLGRLEETYKMIKPLL